MTHPTPTPSLVGPGMAAAFTVPAGDTLIVTDPEGNQIADLIALGASDIRERVSTAETMNHLGWRNRLRVGDALYSNRVRPMLTVIEDTSAGLHDLTFAACTEPWYRFLGAEAGHANCHDSLSGALAPFGMGWDDMPNPVNLFQNCIPQPDGEILVGDSGSAAGDHISLRAEIDLIVAISACPFDVAAGGAADWIPSAIRVDIVRSSARSEG